MHRAADTADTFLNHTCGRGAGLLAEVEGRVNLAIVDIILDTVHERAVFLRSLVQHDQSFDKDVDCPRQKQGEDNHNPAAVLRHSKQIDRFLYGLFSREHRLGKSRCVDL